MVNDKLIYFDNGATTMVDPEVVKEMKPYNDVSYGNASANYSLGDKAKIAIEKSRELIAKSINASSEEIIFTSGGTESNNFAIKSIAFNNKDRGNHIITTKVEHKCVLNSCKWLEAQGFVVTYLDVDKDGFVKLDDLEKAITEKTIIVSIIHGNNEIGTVNDLQKIGEICEKYNIYFHTDACQSYTKASIDVTKINVDLITLNAHKIHGPKGVGALYIKKGTKIKPWQHGGGHEFNFRSGTENVMGIVGFSKSVEVGSDTKHTTYMANLRDKLIEGLLKIPHTKLNGVNGTERLCNNVNISFKGVEGEAIGAYLDQENICSSTGSACSENTLEPSYVLMALGLSHQDANGSLRLTLSRFNTMHEIDKVIKILPEIIKKLREMSPIGAKYLK
jgi:cysteine desulfurase